MDPITLLAGGGLVAISAVLGWLAGRASMAHRKPASAPLMCSCGHGAGHHKDGVRSCHADIERRDGYGMREHVRCACQLYDGPEPLPRTWTQAPLP